VDQAEIDTFVQNGANAMTAWTQGGEQMLKFANSFETRGGTPTFGDDALQIVTLSNDFQAFLTPERRAIISRLRIDI
jgi:hypothetical protein